MNRMFQQGITAFALLAGLSAPLVIAQNAQALSPRADPLLSVDLNRQEIVGRLMTQWQAEFAPAQRDGFKANLLGLRADRLLAVSLVGSFDGVLQVLYGQEKADQAAVVRNTLNALGTNSNQRDGQKALGDASIDLVYTPLTPCRLFDTRTGQGSLLGTVGGIFNPNTRRTISPAGGCGVPASGVKSLVMGLTTRNSTPGSGGYIAVVAPGAGITATVDIFNLGSEWSATTVFAPTSASGQFDVFVSTATADVVMDVVGYFAPPPQPIGDITEVNTGTPTTTGLTGGTTSGIAALSLTPGFKLPQGCTTNQIPSYNSGTGLWACATDANSGGTVTNVTASAPLASTGGTTPNISLTGVVPLANIPDLGAGYIKNGASLQASSNFNISGNGFVAGNVGVGTTSTSSKLTVAGTMESTSGGVKFPDGTTQASAPFQWQVVAGTTQQALPNFGYTLTNASQVTVTLPTAPNVGDTVRVSGVGTGGWKLAQNAGQFVNTVNLGPSGSAGQAWTPRDSARDWQSVASSADGSKLVAAHSGGFLYTSIDSGVTWLPRDSVRNWNAVASSTDGNKLVAVDNGGRLYTSTDSGATWTVRESTRNWYSVASSADGSKLVAGVQGGQLYTSIDSGVTWLPRDSARQWYAVASSADGGKLVAVDFSAAGRIYTSTDSGVTWFPRESNRLWVSVASSADGGKLVAGVNGGQIYTSTDSGVTWLPRESSRSWQGIASSADGSKLLALNNPGMLYTSIDFGVTWTPREKLRNWASVASSADGSKLVAAAYLSDRLYTTSASTTLGAVGYLSGGPSSAIELQYIGSGQFVPISYVGAITNY